MRRLAGPARRYARRADGHGRGRDFAGALLYGSEQFKVYFEGTHYLDAPTPQSLNHRASTNTTPLNKATDEPAGQR
ncbi:hypothetical protein Psuf_066390 [Phytohabitans suffuscus]|uniref:Uncharacterized protein n=1 Tax=Phytohabitans suffuscus TaxID=624315 RepID=A0A6F8YTE9_9ACTN|nr:hypothetical protein Psuf_066390 [Phytohabitans suffuscus]